jgi:hypothetical protein
MPERPPGPRRKRRYDPSRANGALEARWSASSLLALAGVVPLSLVEGLAAVKPVEAQPSGGTSPHSASEKVAADQSPQPSLKPPPPAGRGTPDVGPVTPLPTVASVQGDNLVAALFARTTNEGPLRATATGAGGVGNGGGGGSGLASGGGGSPSSVATPAASQPVGAADGGAGSPIGVLSGGNSSSTQGSGAAPSTATNGSSAPNANLFLPTPTNVPDPSSAAGSSPSSLDTSTTAPSSDPGSTNSTSTAKPTTTSATQAPKLTLNLQLGHHLGTSLTAGSSPLGTANTGVVKPGPSPSTNLAGQSASFGTSGQGGGNLLGGATSLASPGSLSSISLGSTQSDPSDGSTGSDTSGAASGSLPGGSGAAFSAAFSRPLGGGAGGLVERAWNNRQDAPYVSPSGSGEGATDGGETAYRTLDALIDQYVDNVLTSAGPDRTDLSGSLDSGVVTGTDGVGSFTFSVIGSYSLLETTPALDIDDDATFGYSFHETGDPPDGSSFTFDDLGSSTLTSIDSNSVTTIGIGGGRPLLGSLSLISATEIAYITGSLIGSDCYTLLEGQTLAVGSGMGDSSADASDGVNSSLAGDVSWTYSEIMEDLSTEGDFLRNNDNFTWDAAGTVSSSTNEGDIDSDGSPTGSVTDGESSGATDLGTEIYSVHTEGDDDFDSLGSFFTDGDRDYTWDEQDNDNTTGSDNGTDAVTATGGIEIDTYSDTNTGGSTASTHESGTLGYTAQGGDDFSWDQSGSYAYATTATTSETATDHSSSSESGYSDVSTVSDYSTETSTETDTDGGTVTTTLHQSGSQTSDSEAVVGGSEDYSYGEYDQDTDTLVAVGSSTGGETGFDSTSVGSATITGTSGSGTSTSSSETEHETDSPTIAETGNDAYGFGGAVSSGIDTVVESEAGVLSDDTLHETDVNTSSSSENETDYVAEATTSISSSDSSTDTDTIFNTGTSNSGDVETDTESLGAGGVLTAGLVVSNSSETDTATDNDSDSGTDTSGEIDHEQSSIGGDFVTSYESDGETDNGLDVDTDLGTSTMVESGLQSLGSGGIGLGGVDASTMYDRDTDYPTAYSTVTDTSSGSETETDLVGDDSVSTSAWDGGLDTTTGTDTEVRACYELRARNLRCFQSLDLSRGLIAALTGA